MIAVAAGVVVVDAEGHAKNEAAEGFCADTARGPPGVRTGDDPEDEAVLPAELVVSATAMAGTDPVHAPIPTANAAAPTRTPVLSIAITRR